MGDKAIEEVEAVAEMAERGQLTNEEYEVVQSALLGAGDEAQGSHTAPGQDSATETYDERMARRFREIRAEKKAAAREAAKATETDEERREREIREAAEAVVAAEEEAAQAAVVAEAVKDAKAEAEAAGQTLTPREISIVKIRARLYGRG